MTRLRANIPGDRARLVERSGGRLACSECVARSRTGERQFGADDADRLWEFQREETRDTAKADTFELRRLVGRGVEFRVVSSPLEWPAVVPEWQPYPWGNVLCFGCAYEDGIIRLFDPLSGLLRRVPPESGEGVR